MSFVEDLWPWLGPLDFLEKYQLFKESILQFIANMSCGSTELEACRDESAMFWEEPWTASYHDPTTRSSALTTSFSSSSLVTANKPETTTYKKTNRRKMRSLSFLLSAAEESRIEIKSSRVFRSNPSLQTSKNGVLLFEGRTGRNGVEMQIEKVVRETAGESTASLVGGSHNDPTDLLVLRQSNLRSQ
ncbi:hypothetical protein ACFX11_002558 [Malus domestica]